MSPMCQLILGVGVNQKRKRPLSLVKRGGNKRQPRNEAQILVRLNRTAAQET